MINTPAAKVELHWGKGYNFTAKDNFGHTLTVDAPTQPNDQFDGFKPTYLLLTGLGACTGIDVVSILKKKRQEVTSFDVSVHGEQQEDWPKAWTRFHVEYTVTGHNINAKAVERAIQLSEEKYCSVSATLSGSVEITRSYKVISS